MYSKHRMKLKLRFYLKKNHKNENCINLIIESFSNLEFIFSPRRSTVQVNRYIKDPKNKISILKLREKNMSERKSIFLFFRLKNNRASVELWHWQGWHEEFHTQRVWNFEKWRIEDDPWQRGFEFCTLGLQYVTGFWSGTTNSWHNSILVES